MNTEKTIIKCESIFNDDHTHRFSWKRVWNKDKPLAAVLVLNPCISDNILTDVTTFCVVNNVARLETYGGVVIVNLFSLLTSKLNFRWNADEDLNDPENDNYIKKAAEECDTMILAWGKASGSNQRIADRVAQVMAILEPYREKLAMITDGSRVGLHPLTPSIRAQWFLEALPEPSEQEANAEASVDEAAMSDPA